MKVFSIAVFISFICFIDLNGQSIPGPGRYFSEGEDIKIYEKIFLKLNRDVIKAGDSLNYSVFTFHTSEKRDFPESKYLNLDLVSRSGDFILNQRLIFQDGVAFGRVTIPEKTPEGEYLLIAHTDVMKGAIDKYFYKGLRVTGEPILPKNEKVILESFPEGDFLVKNLANNLIIKSSHPNGKGLAYSGKVLNSNFEEIGEFQTNEEGFCKLLFKPSDAKKYYLKGNKSDLVEITPVQEEGLNLRLVNLDKLNKISFEIESSPGVLADSLTLSIHNKDFPLVHQRLAFKDHKVSMSIPYEFLANGLHRLVVQTDQNSQVLSRYFFIEGPDENLRIKGIETGSKDSLIIALQSEEDIGYQFGHFTFPNDPGSEQNLDFLSYAKLGALLKEDSYHLKRFFNPSYPERLESLDLFLSTIKSSHIDGLEQVIEPSIFDSLFTYKLLFSDSETGKPLFKERILVFSEALAGYKETLKTDENGLITLADLYFVGEKEFYFEKAFNSHQDFKIELIEKETRKTNSPIPRKILYPILEISEQTSPETKSEKGMDLEYYTDLEAFTIESERIRTEQKYRYRPESMLGLGNRVKVAEEEVRHPNPLKLVESYGVQLIPTSRGYSAKIKGRTPTIFWDGIKLNQASMINNYSAYSVAEFDVYYNGVITFFSKSIEESLNNKFNSILLKGFGNTDPHSGIIVTNFKVERNVANTYFKMKKGFKTINFQGVSEDGTFYRVVLEENNLGVGK
ncbi:hypothetical protein AAGF08_05015 [Algoriphagus sp. SE2]|uniref:hypothetical protein n=1 Tax=Algoriphagus sp. SE2 TaxID=3141536 RepID=UPI0031CD14B5